MRQTRQIMTYVLSLSLLLAAGDAGARSNRDRPARTGLFLRNGRVAANLPQDGTIAPAWHEESLAGLRWPGAKGTEFAGSGGFYLRFRVVGDEEFTYVSPDDFSLLEPGSSGASLFEGCPGGIRYPVAGCDDDGDGLVDEDPFDGLDNDGDGSTDEDFCAIGNSMTVSRAGVPRAGIFLTQCGYLWSFGHVRDFIAFSTRIDYSPEDPEKAAPLAGFGIAQAIDLDIGDGSDERRGEDDSFFYMRSAENGDSSGSGADLPDGRELFFAAAGGGAARESFGAVVILGAALTSGADGNNTLPAGIGPGSALAVALPAVMPAEYDVRNIWDEKEPPEDPAGEDEPGLTEDPGTGLEFRPEGDFLAGGRVSGDHSIIYTIGDIPALLPGEGVRIDWAVVFGRSPERLAENVARAVETYRGARDGEGRWNRWIVPARKAERIEVPARLAPVWFQGKRMPAVSIALPSDSDEEVEWLKVSTGMIESFEQIEGRVVATVPMELIERGSPLLVEGQLSDGTIFRALISVEEIEIFTGDDSTAPDKLPEDCLKIFPNPFVLDLNISLNVEESPAELYRSADRTTSGISSVRVYDVKGRLVRTVLEEEFLHPGEYSMGWDGKDENGIQVQPGVYYCKLQIGDRSVTKRVVLLR